MDHFVEQIIRKRPEPRDLLKRLGIALLVVVIFLLSLLGTLMGFSFLIILTVGAFYLGWFLWSFTKVEYEYIVTNNELDVDKIMGQRKRKRLITLKINRALGFGQYNNVQDPLDAAITVAAHDCSGENLWYLLCEHEKHGKTLLLFTPNEDILLAVNAALPIKFRNQDMMERLRKKQEAAAATESDFFSIRRSVLGVGAPEDGSDLPETTVLPGALAPEAEIPEVQE